MHRLASSCFVALILLGACAPSPCPQASCPRGMECVDGVCVEASDPCEPVTCNPNATCRSGSLGAAVCECDQGFVVIEAVCPDVDACRPEEVFCELFSCSSHEDCEGDLLCNSVTGACVECLSPSDCCDDCGYIPHCHPETYTCVECLLDSHCWEGSVCRSDLFFGEGFCFESCGNDLDCDPVTACIGGACRLSYCSPTGEVDGASVQKVDYGSSCVIHGESGEESYRGFCLGPAKLGDRLLGACLRTGDRPDNESCAVRWEHGEDYEHCQGYCFSEGGDWSGVCYPPCHPGECEEGFCHPLGYGLLGVCYSGWDGEPRPVGSSCDASSLQELSRACGEGRLCVDSVCRVACDLAEVVRCPSGGGDCGPLEHPDNWNSAIGWCR